MKSTAYFRISVPVLFFLTIAANAQENENAGMPVRDLDGNVYRVIMTESGVWMADNLQTLKFNDGKPIRKSLPCL